MVEASEVRAFALLPEPILTAYLDTNPGKTANRGPTPEYLTWLNTEGKSLLAGAPAAEQKSLGEQLARVAAHLRERMVTQRGTLVFAGPDTWQVIPLQVGVENELHWGKPWLAQLLGLLGKHKSYGIAVVDLSGARFFRYRLGELSALEEKKFAIDISHWRKKDMGKVSHVGISKSRGLDRDTFERRMDEQYRRLCAETGQRARQLSDSNSLGALFLVGENRLIDPIAASLPRDFQSRVVKIEEDLAKIVSPALEQRLEPHIEEWERAQEAENVTALLEGKRGVVLGIDRTLDELQKGKLRVLVLADGLDPELLRCTGCGRADRNASPACSFCGSERRTARLREILPELAWEHETEIEIVGYRASARLHEAGGMGGWLRLPKRTSARRATRRAG